MKIRKPRVMTTSEQRKEIARLYVEEEKGISQLARLFDVSSATISDILDKQLVFRRNKKAQQIIEHSQWQYILKEFLFAHKQQSEIAQEFGVSRERIRQILKKCGTSSRKILLYEKKVEDLILAAKKESLKTQVKFVCQCGAIVHRDERQQTQCSTCKYITIHQRRDPKKIAVCEVCAVVFHPNRYYSTHTEKKPRFCSVLCWKKAFELKLISRKRKKK